MNKTNNAIKRTGAGIVLIVIVMLVNACESMGGVVAPPSPPRPPPPPTVVIEITFVDGCARFVSDIVPYVHRGDLLQWKSIPEDNEFKVWFDPFRGGLIKSRGNGKTQVRPIDPNIPKGVLYKYTIESVDPQDPATCPPLDPHIRVG